MHHPARHLLILMLLCLLSLPGSGLAQLNPGDTAPDFTLEDIYGRSHQLASMENHSLIVLYFFDTASPASQEGLLTLDKLLQKHQGTNLIVWGITTSPKNSVSDFITTNNAGIPVILDQKGVSALYQAELILPTVHILGPGRKIIDTFQGGGQGTEKMLINLAERELQRNDLHLAKAISLEVQSTHPDSIEAKTLYGYAALKAEQVNEAEEIFENLAKNQGEAEILGKEGLVTVYARKGEIKKALTMAAEVEKKAPRRGLVNTVKGDILYARNKKKEAQDEYLKAVSKPEGSLTQKAEAHNRLGRSYASSGNFNQARINYDKTVKFDPYNLVAMSNKGVTYQKEGQLDKALEMFQQALSINKQDQFTAVLARKTREMIALQKNIAEKKRIDKLVKELVERYRLQQSRLPEIQGKDTWTSRPLILSFVDFEEKGGLNQRDGMSMVLTTQLGEQLNQSGRVQVVERVLMDRLLEELNLGSSELTSPETALTIGRILAAKVVATGALLHLPDQSLLSLRLIDTETTAIPRVLTQKLAPGAMNIAQEIERLNQEILQTIIQKYPLHGFIVQVNGDQAIINIGSKQGVVPGSTFEAIEEGKTITYKGKELKGLPKTIGSLEVVQVEPDMSSVRILEQKRSLHTDDKVLEKMVIKTKSGGKS